MNPKGWGLAAALVIVAALGLAPAVLMSAPPKPPEVSADARKAGMAQAPALVAAASLPCQVSDARFVGKTSADKKTGAPEHSFYEVACGAGNMGFVLSSAVGQPTTAYSCVEADTSQEPGKPPSLPCILPGNLDPKAVLSPLMTKAGVACTPTAVRGIGQTKTNTLYEVACQEGSGYVTIASAPFDASKPIQAQNCNNFDDGAGNIKCTLTDKATRLSVADKLVAQANNGCTVKDRRFVGTSADGADFYETSCADGKGYIYKMTSGKLAQSWDCGHAGNILGGCQLTDSRQAQSDEAALYTKLAKQAGSSCDVAKYADFPQHGNDEVVELVCKDGASAIGIFPASGKGQVLDCGHALVQGYRCSMGKADYSALTADLQKFNAKSCQVSNARPAAKTQKGTILVEVACADGLPGYMIEYNTSPVEAVAATGCRFVGNCTLPGNKTS
jgi:hypothetical protein